MVDNLDEDNEIIVGGVSNNDNIQQVQRIQQKNDPRLDKISCYTLATLRLKQEKWQKLIRTDELRYIIFEWLNDPQKRILTITLNQAGFLIPIVNFTQNSINPSASSVINKINSNSNNNNNNNLLLKSNESTCNQEIVSKESIGNISNIRETLTTQSKSITGTISKTSAATTTITPTQKTQTPSTGLLNLSLTLKAKGKSAFFVKKQPCILTVDNFNSMVLFGDLPISTVKSLATLFDEICIPLLNNPFNRKLWPEIVLQDLEAQMTKLQSILSEVKGEISNRTILSITMPIKDIEELEKNILSGYNDTCEEKFHNQLEGMMITWSTQINSAINENLINPLDNYLPSNEVSYWIERHEHLQNIYEQLYTPAIKSICLIMEKLNSVYSITFKKIFKSFIIALHEANEISLWLKPFLKHSSILMEVNFINAKSLISPLIHLVEVISIKSRYYCTTKRISTLLRSICNLLVSRAYEDLELSLLFHIEPDEGLLKIEKTIEILEYFKKKVLEHKVKNSNCVPKDDQYSEENSTHSTSTQNNIETLQNQQILFPNSSWSFQPKNVFLKLNLFVEQLTELMKIFETAVSFQNLEKLQIGGNKGKYFMSQVENVYSEFKELFQKWTSIEIDFMNETLKRKKFQLEQKKFFKKSDIIEKKLATILGNAFLDCSNSEQFLKLIQISGNIIKRPAVLPDITIVLTNIFDLFEIDLQQIENLCSHIQHIDTDIFTNTIKYKCNGKENSNSFESIVTDKNFPCVSGCLMWIYKIKCRAMRNSVDHLLDEYPVLNCDRYNTIQIRRNQIIDNLTEFEKEILTSWLDKTELIIDNVLDNPILTHHYILPESNQSNHSKFKKFFLPSITTTQSASISASLVPILEKPKDILSITENMTKPISNTIELTKKCENFQLNEKLKYSRLKINFPSEFSSIFREIKCINSMKNLENSFADKNDQRNQFKVNQIGLLLIEIPERLMKFYQLKDELWNRVIKLNYIVEWYNVIRIEARPCEFILIESELIEIDKKIMNAVNNITWRNYDENFIQQIYLTLKDIYQRVHEIQNNLNTVLNKIQKWIKEPLHRRKFNGKKFLDIENQKRHLKKRIIECEDLKKMLDDLMLKNFQLFFKDDFHHRNNDNDKNDDDNNDENDDDRKINNNNNETSMLFNTMLNNVNTENYNSNSNIGSTEDCDNDCGNDDDDYEQVLTSINSKSSQSSEIPRTNVPFALYNYSQENIELFRIYQIFIDDLIGEELLKSVRISLQYLKNEMKNSHYNNLNTLALFEVKLELQNNNNICFVPSFDTNIKNNFLEIIKTLVQDILEPCKHIQRIIYSSSSLLLSLLLSQSTRKKNAIIDDTAIKTSLSSTTTTTTTTIELEQSSSSSSSSSSSASTPISTLTTTISELTKVEGIVPVSKTITTSATTTITTTTETTLLSEEKNEMITEGFFSIGDAIGSHKTKKEENHNSQDSTKKTKQEENFLEMKKQYTVQNNAFVVVSNVEKIIGVEEKISDVKNFTTKHPDETENYKKTFYSIISENDEIKTICEWIIDYAYKTMQRAIEFSKIFDKYKYLWLEDKNKHLKLFLETEGAIASDSNFKNNNNNSKTCDESINTHIIKKNIQHKPLSLEKFKNEIDKYQELYEEIEYLTAENNFNGWLSVDANPLKQSILNHACKWGNLYKQWLLDHVATSVQSMQNFISTGTNILNVKVDQNDLCALLEVMSIQQQIKLNESEADNMFKPLKDVINALKFYSVKFDPKIYKTIENLPMHWSNFKTLAIQANDKLTIVQEYQRNNLSSEIIILNCFLKSFRKNFIKMQFFMIPCENVYNLCDEVNIKLKELQRKQKNLTYSAELLSISPPDDSVIAICYMEIKQVKQLWDFVQVIESYIIDWKHTAWRQIDADDMENECRKFTRDLRTLDKKVRIWQPYIYIENVLKDLVSSLRVITELQNLAITERHWVELMHITKLTKKFPLETLVNYHSNHLTKLSHLLSLNFHNYEEEVKNMVDRAIKEMSATKILNDIKKTWYNMEFECDIHPQRNVKLLKVSEELIETLDDNQMQLQNISTSKYIEFILPKILKWQAILTNIDSLITLWFEVQRKWMYLESIFIGSSDIRAQLPEDSKNFETIDLEFTELLLKTVTESMKMINVIKDLNEINIKLQDILKRLTICEKSLNNYLETKRLTFPRFYFISSADLLNILSNGNNPKLVDRHLIKLFDSILRFEYKNNLWNESNESIKISEFDEEEESMNKDVDENHLKTEDYKMLISNGNRIVSSLEDTINDSNNKTSLMQAIGMHSKENDEYVEFITSFECSGRVELWLNIAINVMRSTLKHSFKMALLEIQKSSNFKRIIDNRIANGDNDKNQRQIKSRSKWIFDWPAQTALCCSQICWTSDVNKAFSLLEEGYETAMKDFHKEQIAQLNTLINLLLGELTPGDRQKIMTICTIDVHSRDVVLKIIQTKVQNSMAFQWQSQLRHRWDKNVNDCYANICDAEFLYAYEYLGNTTRLVITPLTDRCYITLTQSLHLIMGGAPAGPAGTGKTETTKDLGRALGVMVYVFNCSEQMDYKSCGNIYKGLSQTGAWGCFDEFNRISVEVLSVIAVQVKTIQDAIKSKKSKFIFMGEQILLIPSIGIFITMNPGYAGRTELPENLKTLFRPCAMIVPDFALICEIMLVAEGFQNARLLARKFITLYTLCKELLSKQDHYDWGLRAIKSVLVVAGALKRGDPNRPEDQVLMRALRDFNIPKIITEDIPIFVGLVGDLFPALDVPRKRLLDFERIIRKAVNEIKLQSEENFILKIVQLQELLSVRHSVFIVGNAGTGKTRIWQSLLATFKYQKQRPHYSVLNPKALTNDELFGVVNSTTREWKDGLFSSIMRDQANIQDKNSKWIILDGDIDPMWIESLNTLMDDNKVLTLASNERIALKKTMRLLFEVGHLKSATPATVSRAGILYINPQDLGWFPYVSSWVETRENIVERGILTTLFEKYFPNLIKKIDSFKKITPISNISMIQLTCFLLESMLDGHKIPPEYLEKTLEIIFVFVTIWGFGSGLSDQDHLIDWRREFHKWWTIEFKDIKFPNDGIIFDFYLDQKSYKFQLWENLIQTFELDPELPLQNVLVPTIETCRITYFIKNLIKKHHPVMLVGGSGCGKYSIYREIFNSYNGRIDIRTTNFNYYTNSDIFQKVLDHPLEKKSGRFYAPSGNKRLIYYIRDLNMPEVDSYGTVQSHTVIRQFMDYHQWYDRNKLTLKEIRNCQFAVSMNPTAGSFTIDPRLQRHFCIFTVNSPNEETLIRIFSTILGQHLDNIQNSFSKEIKSINEILCSVGVSLHRRIESAFLPTAVKFHYIFNLRDMSNIFQGLMNSNGFTCQKPMDLIRFYVHESFRVYHDKLADQHDIKAFRSLCRDVFKKDIEDFDEDYVFNEPLIYCNFAQSLLDKKYMPIKNWNTLYELLMDAQNSYNEIVGYMNLVMFEDAMLHVCRINRILEMPRSNALLIGVGGSGKQTLARLASFISSLSVYQIQIKRGYTIQDMKNELANLYTKVGLKNVASVFLISDAQIPDESILMLVNDMLASGEIPELFTDDQFDTIVNGVRNEVKQNGTIDTKDNCWKFFIEKVRRLLKTVLCFSPVGTTLRIRARKFPAIISRTNIDWFHEWPKTALESVSKKFLSDIDVLSSNVVDQIGCFMAYVHGTVNQISKIYFQNEKRFNYTTPKTFLEYISLFIKLLENKSDEYTKRITRLESGMSKLAECAIQVEMLKKQLAIQEIELNAKNAAADNLIVIVGAENEKVKKEKFAASEEEQRVRIIEEDVSMKTQLCEEDLRKAEPALVAAHEALDTLNKNNLTELKSFGSPPKAVVNVCAAVMVLFATNGRIPKDRSWKAAKLMMVKVDQFLNDLVTYDKDNIHPNVIEALQEYLKDPEFNPDKIVQKSVAAAGLCAWVINLHRYHEIYQIVGPKQKALEDSQEELQEARERLNYLKEKICNLEEKLSQIQSEFNSALAEKQRCQMEADKTTFTIDLAHRLVNGLANENIRWKESVSSLRNKIVTLPGDILLISSFLSYVGCFTRRYRQELQEKLWIPTFKKIDPIIPHTEGVDPLTLIADDAQIAMWNNEGLPMDKMSTENATILTNSTRWPLMIDPQLQGLKWIKNRLDDDLIIIRLTQKGYLDVIEKAMGCGKTVLIEQIGESLDAVLEPLLSRSLIKKGRFIKIGDKEMDYNSKFRLILHTKIPNPHYKPEMQAQTTLINFTVTPDGLEEQLLAEVVKIERPDLENMKTEVTIQQNKFKISLKQLEDELLVRLATAGENVLEDAALVLNLEATKKTVSDIEIKVDESKITTLKIDETRDIYRSAAKRAAILYFVLNDLYKINPIYKFSLKAFMIVFKRSISMADNSNYLNKRVESLVNSITYQTHLYTSRGLFERDKLIFTSHMILRILINSKKINKDEMDFLLRYPHDPNNLSPYEFLNKESWGGIKYLSLIENFYGIDKDIENYTNRWRKFIISEIPEKEIFPGEWKLRTPLQKLCIIRAVRPDRMIYAMRLFIEQTMGKCYTEEKLIPFNEIFKEITSSVPVFFILSPGIDPIRDVEILGKKLNYTTDNENLHNISLGQGQEYVAEQAIEQSIKYGHWVILQNVHLVAKWLPTLEKLIERTTSSVTPISSCNKMITTTSIKLKQIATNVIQQQQQQQQPQQQQSQNLIEIDEIEENERKEILLLNNQCHTEFRLYISAEPAPDSECHVIPQGILECSMKIVNEPPTGMSANLHKAWNNFNQDTLETCTQEAEFKSILFTLCYFHSVLTERRKFGAQGWNKNYPFNIGDLTISANVLYNYLEGSNRTPWEDLRYLFGEIMYGGHITDDWDRRLCRTYLDVLMQQDLIDGDFELCPGFPAPPNLDFDGYHSFINDNLPDESPILYGLHSNAEIGFLTSKSDNLLKTIFELQPRESELCSDVGASREEIVKIMIDDILDKLQDEFKMIELMGRIEKKTPFVVVALQECERMNLLIREIKRSLRELMLGLKGELTITSEMESLDNAIFYDYIPESWSKLAYPSLIRLQPWFSDLYWRIKELSNWVNDLTLPASVWLGGLFNPQSFLTAIMQESARKNDLPLDKMCLCCEVTKKEKDDISSPPKEGAFIHGLFIEGASWDYNVNSIVELRPKELYSLMPVIYVKSIIQEKQDIHRMYECPLYRTRERSSTYIWTFNLRTKEHPSKWILGGVALLLQT